MRRSLRASATLTRLSYLAFAARLSAGLAREWDARFVANIGQVFTIGVEEGAAIVRRWLGLARRAGVAIQFEAHRNALTNDLFGTLQLMEAVPDMPICADLSHLVVDREFRLPIAAENQVLTRRVIARAPGDAALNFLCELGPPEYAMTGPDGRKMSDRWGEALTLRAGSREA